MVHKFGTAVLVILLSVGLVVVQESTALAKQTKKTAVHKRSASAKIHRTTQKVNYAPQQLVLRSHSVMVEDQRTGESLFQKRAEAILPIASITKLMTAMVVLDAQLNLQEPLTIEQEDVDMLRHSRSHLPVGSCITRKEALLLALMASENRAAHALGRTYPGGLDAFVPAMNAKAQSLGLTETRFKDPTGLSSANVSSARNLARMVDTAYQYSLIREFSTCEAAVVHTGSHTRGFRNTNSLVRSARWQIGLSKTGFIDEAGRCLVMQAKVAKRPVVIVLLDAQGKMTRFADANRIRQWIENPPPSRRTQRG